MRKRTVGLGVALWAAFAPAAVAGDCGADPIPLSSNATLIWSGQS